ncbi:MAG TPA: transporter substrate-binding domain-containing protein [Acetobacteraceae bacterium]|nr:transporter substrate-binding domain-containing protein [Acetobacteraceae bacterium]
MTGSTIHARPMIKVGIIFSTTGSYATIGRDMRDGALLAVQQINRDDRYPFTLEPVVIDPAGSLDGYRNGCEALIRGRTIRHVIGCYTSSSRKEIIPVIEKYDALLWYPSHYEGFESSDSVIYGGAAPNQHLVPLAQWVLPRFGTSIYCIGSNYIWPWENNRIIRQIAGDCGGRILRERYLPVGSTDVEETVQEIAELKPDFIFNTLIGESSYAFYRAYHALGRRDPAFAPDRRPVTSCSLSEPELQAIGGQAACGHIASSVYFQSIARRENEAFVASFQDQFGLARVTSADAEAAWIVTWLLARGLRAAGTSAVADVKRALNDCRIEAPQGPVWIDAENNHAWLTPRVGRSVAGSRFEVLWEAETPVRPDPYLARLDTASLCAEVRPRGPRLRLVGR